MRKSLSLLLAIAMVFTMFASVASAAENAQDRFDVLKEAGVFEGYPDGSAGLERQMTRAEFSKVLALLTEAPSNPTANTYTDVPATHWASEFIGAVTAAGLMNGVGLNKFDPNGTVTVEQVAATLVRALGLDEASGNLTGSYSPWAQGYIVAAQQAGLPIEGPNYKANALRSVLVDNAYTVWVLSSVQITSTEVVDVNNVNVTFSDGEVVAVKLDTALVPNQATNVTVKYLGVEFVVSVTLEQAAFEANAIGAKLIEVKLNKAFDEAAAQFAVTKGSITVNVATKTVAADKKSVVLELSSKLTEGEYTVTATGVETAALTDSFTATNERVEKVEFLSNVAPLVNINQATQTGNLAIPYIVENQYGENITRTTSLTASQGNLDPVNGLVNIAGNYKVGDVIALTIINVESTKSAVGTFTVSAEARAAELTITGVYNKDNKTLNEDINLSTDLFYLLVDAKDQYNNPVKSLTRLNADVIVNQTNNLVVSVDTDATAQRFTTVTVNGVERTALPLKNPLNPANLAPASKANAGTTTITLISNTTGKNATQQVVVEQASRVDSINLINPTVVVQGEETRVVAEAFDASGAPVTSVTTLNDTTKGVRVTVNGQQLTTPFVTDNNVIYLRVPASAVNTMGLKPIVALTSSNKVTTLNLDVKAAAVPTVIRGVKENFGTTLRTAQTKTINLNNLAIEDQYARLMSDSSVANFFGTAANSAWEVVVNENTNSNIVTIPPNSVIDTAAGTVVTAGTTNGSEQLTFTFRDANGLKNASTGNSTFRVTDGTQYTSYAVDAIGTVYDNADTDYNKEIKVFGVLSDGGRVQLTHGTDFTTTSSNSTVNADIQNGVISANTPLTNYGDKDTVTVPVVVTINSTGTTFTEEVVFSKATPKVNAVKFVNSNQTGAGTVTTKTVTANTTFSIATLATGNQDATNVVVTDQYGVSVVANPGTAAATLADGTEVGAPNVTIQPVTGSLNQANNGTPTASATGLDVGDVFDVIVTYASGASATIRVTVN